MSNFVSSSESTRSEIEITLGLLSAVEDNDLVTQRSLSGELGIALGLTNAYLKRCIKKGHIKVKQVPANRYAYYLTPKGFAEKSRLMAEYFSQSFKFFRAARLQIEELLIVCLDNNWKNIWLYGAGDLGEIATLCASNHNINLRGIIDPNFPDEQFAKLPVLKKLSDASKIEAIIITDLDDPQRAYELCLDGLNENRVLIAPFLRISRSKINRDEDIL